MALHLPIPHPSVRSLKSTSYLVIHKDIVLVFAECFSSEWELKAILLTEHLFDAQFESQESENRILEPCRSE